MRIILVQAEIEEAIRAYVHNQIVIKEGQEVTIDFKNTRGDDGATAEINISAARTGSQTRPSTATAPVTRVVLTQPTAQPAQPAAQPSQPAAAISTGEARVDPAEAASHTHQSEQAREPQPAAEPKEETPAPAPAAKSLFAHLTKPVHDPKPE